MGACKLCGALVQNTDEQVHAEFHEKIDKSIESNIAQWVFLSDTLKASVEWWKRFTNA